MTATANTTTAAELEVGDLVRVSDRLAKYHSRPELTGWFLPVVAIKAYSADTIGLALEGLPETGIAPTAELEVAPR